MEHRVQVFLGAIVADGLQADFLVGAQLLELVRGEEVAGDVRSLVHQDQNVRTPDQPHHHTTLVDHREAIVLAGGQGLGFLSSPLCTPL